VDFNEIRERSGDAEAGWSKTARRGKPKKTREIPALGGTQPLKAAKRKIRVDEVIRVADLAHQMQIKSGEIIRILLGLGSMATINQSLDADTAALVAAEFGYEVEKVGFSEREILAIAQEKDRPEDLVARPPVATIMGHVDHGKTSLLDAIRKSSVATGEAGGITQHIGAYKVTTKKGEIVFLDTPGHEAFTAMRARGAEVTDIVVLVVAADDGVMEQTREAINHARAAGVPIMVAVNKMDKEGANPDRVKRELADQGLVAEDWGGDTTFSHVSAKTRQGLDDLLELLALQADILELKANPGKPARGHIVEARLDKGRGSLGTVLIQEGTLRLGDAFVCGVHAGRVRAMFDDQGKKVKEAGPSTPVEVQGFEGVPEAGEEFICLADEKAARRIAEARALKQRERELAKESRVTLETFLAHRAGSAEAEVLNLVIKCDVQGSLEAIAEALHKLSTEKARINVIHGGAGAVSESDVLLASASEAIIIGFNVRPTAKAKELAEREKVDIRFYDIIYKLVEEIKSAMEGMLAPVSREVFLGSAAVREIFSVPKVGVVAGCHVSEGKVPRGAQSRLLRDGVVIHTGKIASLRRFKDDVREVAKGYECGIVLENYSDLKSGDVLEIFETVEEAASL
jgi:translation initiation factor IF-2